MLLNRALSLIAVPKNLHPHSRGFLYCAIGRLSTKEVLLSASILFNMSNYGHNITVITDDRGIQTIADAQKSYLFHRILNVNEYVLEVSEVTPGTGSRIAKMNGIINTPYDETLFLDVDTEVCANTVDRVFQLLDRFDLAITHANKRYSENIRPSMQIGFVEMNTGVIAYKRNNRTLQLFTDWKERWLADGGDGVDQYHFHRAMWKNTEVRSYILPPEYNCRKVATCNDNYVWVSGSTQYFTPCIVKHSHFRSRASGRTNTTVAAVVMAGEGLKTVNKQH
eukprot:CFRG8110T1